MAHIRRQLREQVKTLLDAATGLDVDVNRTHVIQPDELPCIIVTTDSDVTEPSTLTGYDREIALSIKIYERSRFNVDDSIDGVAVAIENAMRNDTTIAADQIDLQSTVIDIDDGDQQIAVATMSYAVRFFNISDPETLI